MTKTNIDLGADTSFGISASADVTAGCLQETNVGFDSTTKFLMQCGWNRSALNMSCSYSLKEWLITGKKYRDSGLLSKYATQGIDIGCKSFFSGAGATTITSKDKVVLVSDAEIKVRVSKDQNIAVLSGDDRGALLLNSGGICKIEKCDVIKINIGGDEKVSINKSGTVSLGSDSVKLDSDGVSIFETAVSVEDAQVTWLGNNLVAKEEDVKWHEIKFTQNSVQAEEGNFGN